MITALYLLGLATGLSGCAAPLVLVVRHRSTWRDIDWGAVAPYLLLAVVSVAALVDHA